jgi:osmoprotectant transport system permease protein
MSGPPPVTADPAAALPGAPAADVRMRGPRDRRTTGEALKRWGSMPAFLAVVWGALYLVVRSRELDSIEARALQWSVIQNHTIEHVRLSVLATVFVIAIAVPVGILCTRHSLRRITPVVVGLGNAGQAIPSLGLITIVYLWIGFGMRGVVAGLVAYSFLPILRNTIVGLDQVDRSLIEAARGMGMSRAAVLRKIELPLAIPVMLAGIRTALILNVGTVSLAFLFGQGGLGVIIFQGFNLRRDIVLLTGAVIASGLALLTDYLAGIAEEVLSPKGL